jgi:hypothetical protein
MDGSKSNRISMSHYAYDRHDYYSILADLLRRFPLTTFSNKKLSKKIQGNRDII